MHKPQSQWFEAVHNDKNWRGPAVFWKSSTEASYLEQSVAANLILEEIHHSKYLHRFLLSLVLLFRKDFWENETLMSVKLIKCSEI